MRKCLLFLLEAFETGGAQNMVYELLRCMNRDKFDIKVLCYGSRIDNALTKKVEKIQHVEYMNLSGKIGIVTIFKVLQKIDKLKPDILHAHLGGVPFAVLWGIFHRKKIFITAHTKPEKAFSKKIVPILKLNLRKDKITIVAVSKYNQKLLAKFFRINTSKIPYINNGINLQRFYKKKHKNFTFINVGRQDENKNQIAIIRSFYKLHSERQDILLYLVGDGEKHNTLIKEIEKLNLLDCVFLPGNVANTEDYYAKSDCYVQSSHREAMPLTALEAMASGLPLISTDVGGMSDVVQENGMLVTDGDDRALYNSMKIIANMSNDDLNYLSMNSYNIVKNYSSEKMTNDYMRLYVK